jgi:acetate kinase
MEGQVHILVVNAGSSSMKFGLFEFESLDPVATGLLDWAGSADHATITLEPREGECQSVECQVPDYRSGVSRSLQMLSEARLIDGAGQSVRVVGHRLIHGGEEIRRPVRIDDAMKRTILRFVHLAPLHIPAGLDAIDACEAELPGVPQVGLFDTAFFAAIPRPVFLYPLPYAWYEEWGIRRYGFHGTSHAYCSERASEMLSGRSSQRLVICHLGQGASATAVSDGVAVTNTMGFTPLEGLVMGTRSGTVDPGILIHVQRDHGLSVEQLDQLLHKQSGLLGVSGHSSDFRQLEEAARSGHERSQMALDMYAHRVRETIGALAVTLGGLDALVFTGGIGENSVWLRQEVCRGLECLGVHLDTKKNASLRADADVAGEDSAARVLLIHTREDYMIAREARRMVQAPITPDG